MASERGGDSGGRCAAIRDRTPPASATPEQLTCCTPAAPFQRGRLGCTDRVRFARGGLVSYPTRWARDSDTVFRARRFQHRERSTCLSKHPEPGRPSKNRWRSFAGKRHTTLSFACSTALADATKHGTTRDEYIGFDLALQGCTGGPLPRYCVQCCTEPERAFLDSPAERPEDTDQPR